MAITIHQGNSYSMDSARLASAIMPCKAVLSSSGGSGAHIQQRLTIGAGSGHFHVNHLQKFLAVKSIAKGLASWRLGHDVATVCVHVSRSVAKSDGWLLCLRHRHSPSETGALRHLHSQIFIASVAGSPS